MRMAVALPEEKLQQLQALQFFFGIIKIIAWEEKNVK
jgi:hypothetical protein